MSRHKKKFCVGKANFGGLEKMVRSRNSSNKIAMDNQQQPQLTLTESLLLAIPFVALLSAYGLVTGKVNFNQWPPFLQMRVGFWLPVIFCSFIYCLLLLNLSEKRRGTWSLGSLFASVVAIIALWSILSPQYEEGMRREDLSRLSLHDRAD